MSSDPDQTSHRSGVKRRDARRRKALLARHREVRSTPGEILRRSWFAVLNIVESYKLQTLAIVFFWMLVVWVIGANAIYLCEQSLPPGELRDHSIYSDHYLDTYWWVILTITSAGVEDSAAPQSFCARAMALLMVILGICLVTVLTGNVVAILWEKLARRDLMRVKPRIAHVAQYSGHVVICNASTKFEPILRQIMDKTRVDVKAVLVAPKASEYRTDRRRLFRWAFAVDGNPQNLRILKQADVGSAATLVVLSPDAPTLSSQERDYQALLTALAAQPFAEVNPNLRIILEVNQKETLGFVEIFNSLENYPLHIEAVCADDFQERLLSQSCLTPCLSHFYEMLLTVPPPPRKRSAITRLVDTVCLREVEAEDTAQAAVDRADMANDVHAVPVARAFAGKTFRELRRAIEEAGAATVIGYLRWNGDGEGIGLKRPAVTLNPSHKPSAAGQPAPIDYCLTADDELFVIARPEDCIALRAGRFSYMPQASSTPSLSGSGSPPEE